MCQEFYKDSHLVFHEGLWGAAIYFSKADLAWMLKYLPAEDEFCEELKELRQQISERS